MEGNKVNLYPNFDNTNLIAMEKIAKAVHKAYCDEFERQKGYRYWTNGNYDKLPEETKEYDRVTIRAVLKELFPAPEQPNC